MKLLPAAVLSVLLLVSGSGYYISVHGGNVVEDGVVTKALVEKLEDTKVLTVDFTKLTEFPFTEMQVFEPFTPRTDICRAIDLTGWNCLREVPFMVDEHHYFVVFRQQSQVVHREYQALAHGRYMALPNGFKLTDVLSTFRVVRNYANRDESGHPLVYLAPTRPGALSTLND